MRRTISAGVLMTLVLLIPAAPAAAQAETPGLNAACQTVERKLRDAGPGTLGDAFRQARMHRPDGKVVQGEVIRDDPDDFPQDPRPPLTR